MKNFNLVKTMLGMNVPNWDVLAISSNISIDQDERYCLDLCLDYIYKNPECSKRTFLKYIDFVVDQFNFRLDFGDLINVDKIRKIFFSPNPLGL